MSMSKDMGGVKVVHKQNGGLLNAWNDGIEFATGEYLTFVDSDDWVDLDYYERMFSSLGERQVDVYCSGGRYIEKEEKTEIVKTLEIPFFYTNGEHRAELIARTLVGWPTGGGRLCDLGYVWDKIYRTEFIKERVLGWNKRSNYGPWPDAMLELCIFTKAERLGGCLEIGNHYRMNVSGQATSRYWENMPEICCNWAQDAYIFLKNDPAFKELVLQEAFITRCQSMLGATALQYFTHPSNKDTYREKAREYKKFKNKKLFKKAIQYKTSFDTKKSYLKYSIMRYTGLWFLYILKYRGTNV